MGDVKPLRIIFMGTPDFATRSLERLIHSPHELVAVYTQPPKPAGRGQKRCYSSVYECATHHNLPILMPRSLKNLPVQQELLSKQADLIVVAAYGLILPPIILKAPRLGCLNIHASLLPRWRGAAPIQRAIQAGDQETGITFMQMDEGLDTGAILRSYPVKITQDTTGQVLHDELAATGAKHLLTVIEDLDQGVINPIAQDDTKATYAPKLQKDESLLDWTKPAQVLELQIRAFNPWPGSYFIWHNKPVKIWSAHIINHDGALQPGEILVEKDRLFIGCGDGTLEILQVQPAGKKIMRVKEYLNGLKSTLSSITD